MKEAPGVNHHALKKKGFDDAALKKIEAALASAFEIKFAFNKWTLGEEFCKTRLKLTDAQLADFNFDMLAALGFSKAEVEAANEYCCGTMTLEGKPFRPRSPVDAMEAGLGLVPEERRTEGLILEKSLAFNIGLTNLAALQVSPLLPLLKMGKLAILYVAMPAGIGGGSWSTLIAPELAPEIRRPNSGNVMMVFALPGAAR